MLGKGIQASMPDQVLCKQNQRRILEERQKRWMEERAHVIESNNQAVQKQEEEPSYQPQDDIRADEAHASYSRYKDEQDALTKLSSKAKRTQLQKMRATWTREKVALHSEDRPSLPVPSVIQHTGSASEHGLNMQSQKLESGTSRIGSRSTMDDSFDMEDDSTELAEIQDFLLAVELDESLYDL